MISAISSVSFRGEADNKDLNALINQPGKYSNSAQAAPAAQQAPAGDRADLSTKETKKEKSNTGAIIGGIIGALALTWIGLGIAVGRKGSNWTKIDEPAGFADNAKNFFFAIGNSAKKAYDNTLGKWFGKAEKAADDASDVKPKATPDAGEQPKA